MKGSLIIIGRGGSRTNSGLWAKPFERIYNVNGLFEELDLDIAQ